MLRPAEISDRERVFEWATRSDVTAEMMGPPRFADHPIPTWEEFAADYTERFFSTEGDGFGRVYIIGDGERAREIGCISYDGLEGWRGWAELDLWIADRCDWGKGHGSAAIRELGDMLLAHAGISGLMMRPSARNVGTIRAYERAGFIAAKQGEFGLGGEWFRDGLDYADSVVMCRVRNQQGVK